MNILASVDEFSCLEPRHRRTDDGIDILPVELFCTRLHDGEIFG